MSKKLDFGVQNGTVLLAKQSNFSAEPCVKPFGARQTVIHTRIAAFPAMFDLRRLFKRPLKAPSVRRSIEKFSIQSV